MCDTLDQTFLEKISVHDEDQLIACPLGPSQARPDDEHTARF
jgi:hypothetical protein